MANQLTEQTTETKVYYWPLHGLRAVAVWLVFVHHFPPFLTGSLAFAIAKQGYVGVSMFFVISGFLIPHHYYDSAELNQPFFKNYLYKRWARLYPVFFLIATASFITLWLAGFGFSAKTYLLNISFLKGFSDQYKFTGLSQTWSLTVEVCFYLLAPMLFVLHKRFGWFWQSLAACYLAGLTLWLVGVETLHFVAFYTFFGRAFDFFVGFGVWLLYRHIIIIQFFRPISLTASVVLVCVCISILALEDYYQFDETYFGFNYIELITNNLLLPLAIGLLVYSLIKPNRNSYESVSSVFYKPKQWSADDIDCADNYRFSKNYRFVQWLSTPIMQLLGRASYVFFLIHLSPLSKLLTWIGWWGYFIIINLTSVLVYWFIERWVYKKIITILKQ